VRGNGLALPFPTDAFDLVALITTLEFTADPAEALVEALRVARCGLILGVLNRQSPLGWQLRRVAGPIWEAACVLAPSEWVELVGCAAGERAVKVLWGTTLWPLWPKPLPLPWGGYIGMAVRLP